MKAKFLLSIFISLLLTQSYAIKQEIIIQEGQVKTNNEKVNCIINSQLKSCFTNIPTNIVLILDSDDIEAMMGTMSRDQKYLYLRDRIIITYNSLQQLRQSGSGEERSYIYSLYSFAWIYFHDQLANDPNYNLVSFMYYDVIFRDKNLYDNSFVWDLSHLSKERKYLECTKKVIQMSELNISLRAKEVYPLIVIKALEHLGQKFSSIMQDRSSNQCTNLINYIKKFFTVAFFKVSNFASAPDILILIDYLIYVTNNNIDENSLTEIDFIKKVVRYALKLETRKEVCDCCKNLLNPANRHKFSIEILNGAWRLFIHNIQTAEDLHLLDDAQSFLEKNGVTFSDNTYFYILGAQLEQNIKDLEKPILPPLLAMQLDVV